VIKVHFRVLAVALTIHVSVAARMAIVPTDYPTIQYAIDSCNDGDTVLVMPGIFVENVDFDGHTITLASTFLTTGDTSAISSTIIDADRSGQAILLNSGEGASSTICGFTITNGLADYGAGIACYQSGAKILNNRFVDNETTIYGSGIYIGQCDRTVIEGNTLTGNDGNVGTIFIDQSPVVIQRNLLYSNGSAIAIEIHWQGDCIISQNTLVENNSGDYGQITVNDCQNVEINSNIVVSGNGYGIYLFADYSVNCNYNDTWNNAAGDYYFVTPGPASISADPIFGDIHRLSINSPCIDAGDVVLPLDPDGTRADMGAFYFDQQDRILEFHLIRPEDGDVTPDSCPVLLWHATRDTDSSHTMFYSVIRDSDPNFATPDTSDVTQDTSLMLIFAPSVRYYWCALAQNFEDDPLRSAEIWSLYANGAPSCPIIFGPENGAESDSASVLSWYVGIDPDSFDYVTYSIQIDDDSSFTAPEIDVTGLSSEMRADDAFAIRLGQLAGFNNLFSGVEYFWRVKADDSYGLSSNWTTGQDWFVFVTGNRPPNPPVSGFEPSGGVEVATLSPTIHWDNASDPDNDDHPGTLRYVVRMDVDSTFSGNPSNDTTARGINHFQPDGNLLENAHYYYEIMTLDDEGLASACSVIQNFWVNCEDDPPEMFPLNSPVSGFRQVEYSTRFEWGASADPDPSSSLGYFLEISTDSLFTQTFVLLDVGSDTAAGIYTDSITNGGGSYYWRVLAVDDDSLVTVGGIDERYRSLNIITPGDANCNNMLNGVDVLRIVSYLKYQAPPPDPLLAGDFNADCVINGLDVAYAVNYFRGFWARPERPGCNLNK
jgi:hypothetical protein